MTGFDITTLRPGKMSLDLLGAQVESGRSMSGITGAADYSSGGFWSLEYKDIFIETRFQHKYWSLLRNILTGGVNHITVTVDQSGNAPVVGDTLFAYPTFSGGATFSDGATFESDTVVANMSGDGTFGDGTVSIEMVEGDELTGGETFSIFDGTYGWRMYSVGDIDSVVGSVYTVGIKPPLRAGYFDGDTVKFIHPKCQMRLAPGFKIPMEVKPPWHSNAAITFVEASK